MRSKLLGLGCGCLVLIAGVFFGLVIIMGSYMQTKKDDDVGGYNVNDMCSIDSNFNESKAVKEFEANAKGGALEGKTKEVLKIAKKEKVPGVLFLAIIAHESDWGRGVNAKKQNNPLSVMGSATIHDTGYPTIEDGLRAGAKNLYTGYISKGLTTPEKIGPKYAPTVGATNDSEGSNNNWVPNVKQIEKQLGAKDKKGSDCSKSGKDIKFDGKIPKWSGSNPGTGNLYTPGQCTWYAFGIRQKMGKPVSTWWHDAHNWSSRAKEEGYKVGKTPKPGAVFVAQQGAGGHSTVYGHVAIVISASKDGKTFRVSEMNYKGENVVSERDITMTEGYSFIYDK